MTTKNTNDNPEVMVTCHSEDGTNDSVVMGTKDVVSISHRIEPFGSVSLEIKYQDGMLKIDYGNFKRDPLGTILNKLQKGRR